MEVIQHFSTGVTPPRDSKVLREWVLWRLYEGVFSGELPPNAVLGENDLAARLNVSRQPIRDALRQLEADGLIEAAAGNGARRVVRFSLQQVNEIYTLRAALEAVSFREACGRISDAEINELETILNSLEEALAKEEAHHNGYDQTLDFRFHQIVAESTGMPQLQAFLANLWLKTWALLAQVHDAGTYPDTADKSESYRDRRILLESLRARDPERAALNAIAHVNHRREQLTAAIEGQRGRYFFPD